MTNNTDARIAREWAWKALDNDLLDEVPIAGYRAAARHILATTTPPTMADVEWDDEVHAGLCAESTDDGVVRMIGPDWVNDHADHILCRLLPGGIDSLPMSSLTPIPGTRLDLTPRRPDSSDGDSDTPQTIEASIEVPSKPRPEDVPEGEAWQIEAGGEVRSGWRCNIGAAVQWLATGDEGYDLLWDSEVTLLHRLVPESTPDHPTVLTTLEDYITAPAGTIVAEDLCHPWVKGDLGFWLGSGEDGSETSLRMSLLARRVLRWSETL